MSEQTQIPVPQGPTKLPPCRWCGQPATGLVQIEKPRYRNDRGVRVLARRALEAPACPDHINILSWQEGYSETDTDQA